MGSLISFSSIRMQKFESFLLQHNSGIKIWSISRLETRAISYSNFVVNITSKFLSIFVCFQNESFELLATNKLCFNVVSCEFVTMVNELLQASDVTSSSTGKSANDAEGQQKLIEWSRSQQEIFDEMAEISAIETNEEAKRVTEITQLTDTRGNGRHSIRWSKILEKKARIKWIGEILNLNKWKRYEGKKISIKMRHELRQIRRGEVK